jgi:hypothetical protein
MTIVYRFLPSAMLLATLVYGFLAADTAGETCPKERDVLSCV